MSKTIEVRCKSIVVNIYTARTGEYVYYQIADYSSGKRKLWSFSNLDKIHRAGLKKGLGLNALFGDIHVQFQKDSAFFDAAHIWTGSENGQKGGGIEDEGDHFRWLMMSFRP